MQHSYDYRSNCVSRFEKKTIYIHIYKVYIHTENQMHQTIVVFSVTSQAICNLIIKQLLCNSDMIFTTESEFHQRQHDILSLYLIWWSVQRMNRRILYECIFTSSIWPYLVSYLNSDNRSRSGQQIDVRISAAFLWTGEVFIVLCVAECAWVTSINGLFSYITSKILAW